MSGMPNTVQAFLLTLCSSTKEQRTEVQTYMRCGLEFLQKRQEKEEELARMSGQDVKDRLFVLLGEPHRCGNKNPPARYGTRIDQIRESVLNLEMLAIQKQIGDRLELEQLFVPPPTPVPTASDYRVAPDSIDHSVCVGRVCAGEDRRWSTILIREGQCGGRRVEGSDICSKCIKRQEKYTAAPSTKLKWMGRITEEPFDWQHMLGTAWAEKAKPVFRG